MVKWHRYIKFYDKSKQKNHEIPKGSYTSSYSSKNHTCVFLDPLYFCRHQGSQLPIAMWSVRKQEFTITRLLGFVLGADLSSRILWPVNERKRDANVTDVCLKMLDVGQQVMRDAGDARGQAHWERSCLWPGILGFGISIWRRWAAFFHRSQYSLVSKEQMKHMPTPGQLLHFLLLLELSSMMWSFNGSSPLIRLDLCLSLLASKTLRVFMTRWTTYSFLVISASLPVSAPSRDWRSSERPPRSARTPRWLRTSPLFVDVWTAQEMSARWGGKKMTWWWEEDSSHGHTEWTLLWMPPWSGHI